jgi:hypothetical protein
MRTRHVLLVLCLAAAQAAAGAQVPAPVPSAQSVEAAAKILADARAALGGEAKLAAVKTFAATGRTRRISGENLVPIEFEIDVALPDKYVRKDEIPAQESNPSSSGFNGDQLIQIPAPAVAPPRAGVPPPAARGAAPQSASAAQLIRASR